MRKNQIIGALVLIIGGLLLLKQLGIFFPVWLFTWPMILIAIGILIGVRHGFRNTSSVVLILIGGYFLARNYLGLPFELEKFLLPIALIILGIYLMANRKKKGAEFWEGHFDRFEREVRTGKSKLKTEEQHMDYINEESIFCGSKKRVISKTFKGGEITTIFGGTDVDLTHADMEAPAHLEVNVVFGGLKLIVPAHWDVQLGVSNIAASVDDKRFLHQGPVDAEKKLVLSGAVVFGGIEITTY
ncbi:LiaF transmembrane domain-containing protein [Pleomorphovibrio marinus]|uniref:LiaF transmembrane domain-containing protein n=1 Tax=Pleomorphovibrio marinus TaxID=2164132 RepID=UPI000E0B159A|nr:DUF5668 domain-containing protein [Pleomorphovibrio marinus]